jgi:hypothetical protein
MKFSDNLLTYRRQTHVTDSMQWDTLLLLQRGDLGEY